MPASLTPSPADDEVECGNCGASVYHDLLKCPSCRVYLVGPNEPEEERPRFKPKSKVALKIESLMRKIRGEKHPAEKLFIEPMREAALFDDLLRKVGDRPVVERLIEYEQRRSPGARRLTCLQNAISRWEQGNRM
jgi:hypothetical protein